MPHRSKRKAIGWPVARCQSAWGTITRSRARRSPSTITLPGSGWRCGRRAELSYLAGDHLGTTSLTWNSSGVKVAEARHLPYGGERWASGTTPTDYRFTGQRLTASLGLYQMGARWFDPYVNRFVQPDSIIPDLANPQSLNRYSYVYNRPLVYIDSSGHIPIPVIIAIAVAVAKAVDYGWTAWDSYQSSRTLADTECISLGQDDGWPERCYRRCFRTHRARRSIPRKLATG